ncbi:MAG: hypothetical protein OXI41_13665 [Chloroflexota bacterium]|nr:hypothetical protein [Chloroflexota bacterium]MDE2896277.1 hypothetical protein [Chloroflexota bacterium]
MSLPVRTNLEDIDSVCGYLTRKPTGATLAEARAVLDKKRLDGRKLAGLKAWGLIEDTAGKLKITERGRLAERESGAYRSNALREAVRDVAPYAAVVERVVNRREDYLSAPEVAAHWHENFGEEVADSETTLNLQVLCFFQLAQGADLGEVVLGRRGNATRFRFSLEEADEFLEGTLTHQSSEASPGAAEAHSYAPAEEEAPSAKKIGNESGQTPTSVDSHGGSSEGARIFIFHSGDARQIEELRGILDQWHVSYVIGSDMRGAGSPVPEAIAEQIRQCSGAIFVVSAGEDPAAGGGERESVNRKSELDYLLGAASLQYGRKIVILEDTGAPLLGHLEELELIRFENEIKPVRLALLNSMLSAQLVALTG